MGRLEPPSPVRKVEPSAACRSQMAEHPDEHAIERGPKSSFPKMADEEIGHWPWKLEAIAPLSAQATVYYS